MGCLGRADRSSAASVGPSPSGSSTSRMAHARPSSATARASAAVPASCTVSPSAARRRATAWRATAESSTRRTEVMRTPLYQQHTARHRRLRGSAMVAPLMTAQFPSPPFDRATVRALYDRPLFELLDHARAVHRAHHVDQEVQLCTLLSVKTGGCQE